MITALPSHRRRALLALTAAATLICAAAFAGAAASPASADGGSGGSDTLTLSPNHGPVSDFVHADGGAAPGEGIYELNAPLSCDANLVAGPQELVVTAGVITAPPAAASDGSQFVDDVFPNSIYSEATVAALSDPNTFIVTPTTGAVPGTSSEGGRFLHSADGSPADLGAFLADPGAYTVAVVCGGQNFVVGDADNKAIMAWATLTVDADHNWSMSTADPGHSTTKSNSTVAVDAALNPGTSTVALTATVSKQGQSAAAADADGTVQFFRDGTTAITGGEAVTVSGGVAHFTTPDLAAGDHTFTAVYTPSGTAPYNASPTSPASASVTVPTTVPAKADPVVDLTGAPAGDDGIDLTATIQKSDHTTATDASGTVEFWTDGADGAKVGEASAQDGVATLHLDGQQAGADHAFIAKYMPDADAAYNAADSASFTVTLPAIPMSDGDTVTIGQTYVVTFTATDFPSGDTVSGEVHSDPITLPGTATSGVQGGTFTFTVPTALGPGQQHQLVLTGTPSGNTMSFSFTTAGTAGGTTDPAATGSNDPVSFATDWIAANAGNPVAVGGLMAIVTLLLGASVGGWFLFWSRRRRQQDALEQG